MALTAADIGQAQVTSVAPETPLSNVHRLFVDEQISGAPVADDEGRLLGVVSTSDLLRASVEAQDTERGVPFDVRELLDRWDSEGPTLPDAFDDQFGETVVADVMTPDPVTVASHASVADVARAMGDERIHRVIVVKEGYLVGIISALDIAGLVADGRIGD
jgi:CBS domain-containing protein